MLNGNCASLEATETNKKSVQKKNDDLTVATFAAGLAHELANPIDAISRYIHLALECAAEDSVIREYLLKANQGISRTLLVMNELAAYSRPSHNHPGKIVEIHSLLERSLSGLGEDEKFHGISIQKDFCEESIYIEDRGLLIAIQNLYKNAAQAMKGRGVLTIATWRQNGSVGVVFQDTGEGIPETIKEQIFNPFFSTKNRNEGTGIGLTLSREIVERCGGELRCENISEPVPGARFIVVLPWKNLNLVEKNDRPV